MAVLFPDGGLLLVSEREADAVLSLIWGESLITSEATAGRPLGAAGASAPLLVNLSYLQLGIRELWSRRADGTGGTPPQPPPTPGIRLERAISSTSQWATGSIPGEVLQRAMTSSVGGYSLVRAVVGALLFGGATEFRSPPEREALHRLMRLRRGAAEALVEARGRSAMFQRSDVEAACEEVAVFDWGQLD